MLKTLTDTVAVGCLSDPETLQNLADQGYQTLIDLCPEAEGNPVDTDYLKKVGIQYVNVPVSPRNLTDETLQTFKQTVQDAAAPIYVRCASGLRAGVLTLLTLAEQQGWTESDYLEQRQALGLDHKPGCLLAEFAEKQFRSQNASDTH
ncbi:MAG: beta-lactamase hydrolase domain-containing protein [Cyanophyceae cyanobacterium]|jgi:uncharacterized protein (TIGR01244 family)